MTRLTTCADAEAVAQRAAQEVLRHLREAATERPLVHVALAGGRSPKRTYELLARSPEEWAEVEVWFADERCVAPEDEQSNYRMVARSLLDPAGIAAERVHRMQGELGPEEGASRYEAALRANVPRERAAAAQAAPPVLDLIVLGIGEDGHVASLFPDAPTLDADESRACVGVHDSPKPPELSLATLVELTGDPEHLRQRASAAASTVRSAGSVRVAIGFSPGRILSDGPVHRQEPIPRGVDAAVERVFGGNGLDRRTGARQIS